MSDTYASDLEPDTGPSRGTQSAAQRIEAVRGAGRWMPWAGFSLSLIWWAVAAAAVVMVLDLNWVLGQPPMTIAIGVMIAVLPGLLVIMASFMARETARSAAANTLVLESASQLLDPVDTTASRAEVLARRIASSAGEVDQSMSGALAAMKALAGEIGDERLRLESVSYAAADNARDLARQLGGERSALEGLIRELKAQGDMLNEAIPRQAEMMVGAARAASEEIGRADAALDHRLAGMRSSSEMLAGELQKLEHLAADAHGRSDTLLRALARIEESLGTSRQTVDMAVRSSEVAVSAAGKTGEALQAAIASALDDARRAAQEIQRRTREASEDAAMQIANLRQSAEQAAAALKTVGNAARAESDLTERRLAQASDALRRAVNIDERSAPRRQESVVDDVLFAPPPERQAPPSPPRQMNVPAAPARHVDDELFESPAPIMHAVRPMPSPEARIEAPQPRPAPPVIAAPPILAPRPQQPSIEAEPFDPLEDDDTDGDPAAGFLPVQPEPSNAAPARTPAWSSILNDMDREERGGLPREQTAEMVIRKLETSGITLSNIFRPRDKKKIAQAAQRGEGQRRGAISSAAGSEINRVEARLRADPELKRLARDFVAMEGPDAIAALERTQRSNRNASPRLSAFLLLDAAIGEGEARA